MVVFRSAEAACLFVGEGSSGRYELEYIFISPYRLPHGDVFAVCRFGAVGLAKVMTDMVAVGVDGTAHCSIIIFSDLKKKTGKFLSTVESGLSTL